MDNFEQDLVPKTKKNRKVVLIAVILLLISGLGYGGWKFFIEKSESNSATQEQESANNTRPTDLTANWKTYRNKKHGYEIQYPNTWTFEEYPAIDSVGFGNPPPPEGVGEIAPPVSIDISSDSLLKTMQQFSDKDHLNLQNITRDSINIDNFEATKIEGYIVREGPIKNDDGFKATGIFFEKNSTTYTIKFLEQKKDDWENYKIFKQIISTFRFID